MKDALLSFKGEKVFITGHTGFKGAWLTYLLNEIGANVMGFSLPETQKFDHFTLLALKDKIQHKEGDIRNYQALKSVISDFQPAYVIHMAAQALVKKSYEDPRLTIETNVMGSTNLLESVKNTDSVRSLVFITSDKCYENVEWIWGYRENDRIGGRDPYSASKGSAELIFSSYARSFFDKKTNLASASTRAGNVVGGGDWAEDRIIPDCIRAIKDCKPIVLRNPYSTRPWQHVLEPLSGYVMLAAHLKNFSNDFSGAWNFGPSPSEIRTVQQVAQSIVNHLGKGVIQNKPSPVQPHEARLLQLNCDKAHQLLGWSSRWNVVKTLQATADWYSVFLENGDIEQITKKQIFDYFPELL
jgi:CDP-glucose 4,6-dehydratase